MNDTIIFALSGLFTAMIFAFLAYKIWQGWLTYKLRELEMGAQNSGANSSRPYLAPPLASASLIEIADLKERIRKLEAIANGVDL